MGGMVEGRRIGSAGGEDSMGRIRIRGGNGRDWSGGGLWFPKTEQARYFRIGRGSIVIDHRAVGGVFCLLWGEPGVRWVARFLGCLGSFLGCFGWVFGWVLGCFFVRFREAIRSRP